MKKLALKDAAKIFGRLFGIMFKRYHWLIALIVIAVLVQAASGVLGSLFIGRILVDQEIVGIINGTKTFDDLTAAILVMVGIYSAGIISAYVYQILVSMVGQGTQKVIRDQVFEHMEHLPLSYFDTRTHGDIMSIYTNDIDTLREMISRVLPMVISAIVTMIAAFVAMIISSWVMTLVVIGFFFLILIVVGIVTKKSAGCFIGQQRSLGALNGYIEEMISGQKVIKVFNHEEQAKQGFDELNEQLCRYTTKASRFSNILGPITNNLSNIQYVTLALVGGLGVAAGVAGLTPGLIISFLQLGRSFTMPVAQLANQVNMITMALAGAERIFELIDEPVESDNGYVSLVNAKEDENGDPVETSEFTGRWAWKHPHSADQTVTYTWLTGNITMDNVDFGYVKGKTVLHGVSLYANQGQKVAFVGATGAGKTTITNLLNRFYDIEDGKIRFDGININKIAKHDLRRAMGMVLQETNLFTGTVKDNIRYGNPEATDEDVIRAAKLANADNFIRMFPQGYDTVLTGAGAGLSQGQRQLISIARAACANPPVLILDEATSSIDSRTEKLVQQGMGAIMKGRTVFVIAHRLSTVQNSNVIIVLERGTVIERGTHEQLLEAKGKYYQLYTGGKATPNK
ncbi:MAG: ABC transporter ATP-binding protein/permease [Bacilli bacterium]|nr:ABC transporter ATP-binding protein/permease [Bacilli bacterium]